MTNQSNDTLINEIRRRISEKMQFYCCVAGLRLNFRLPNELISSLM
jgi:hypothetical protein